MKETDIVKELMSLTGTTQVVLQNLLGLKSQSSVSTYLKGDSMKVATFSKLLKAMGFELIVKGKDREWKVD